MRWYGAGWRWDGVLCTESREAAAGLVQVSLSIDDYDLNAGSDIAAQEGVVAALLERVTGRGADLEALLVLLVADALVLDVSLQLRTRHPHLCARAVRAPRLAVNTTPRGARPVF